MPRYKYVCQVCDEEQMAFHLYEETPIINCENCDSETPLIKSITSPSYYKHNKTSQQIGSITNEYIEMNREILEEEKQKAKEEMYEST